MERDKISAIPPATIGDDMLDPLTVVVSAGPPLVAAIRFDPSANKSGFSLESLVGPRPEVRAKSAGQLFSAAPTAITESAVAGI